MVVLIASGVAFALVSNDINVFTLTPSITGGLPSFRPPRFDGYVDKHNNTVSGLEILEVSTYLIYLLLHCSFLCVPLTASALRNSGMLFMGFFLSQVARSIFFHFIIGGKVR